MIEFITSACRFKEKRKGRDNDEIDIREMSMHKPRDQNDCLYLVVGQANAIELIDYAFTANKHLRVSLTNHLTHTL